ncbi:hypothetical protein ACIA8C_35455 [Nocardia sp. NPDC051321]|uniref:hypothetical protein n=1 Tax=Nocardia sp. NPDC051321 TaxID=3364323 RepID=UPI0037A8521D
MAAGQPSGSLNPFPDYQAATLVTTANQLNVPVVQVIVDTIRKMLGDPDAVEGVINRWIDANAHLTSAIDGSSSSTGGVALRSARQELDIVWEGKGCDAAKKYVDDLISSTEKLQERLSAVTSQLSDLRGAILKAYTVAINHILDYGNKILGFAGGLLEQGSKLNILGVGKEVIGLLSGFVEATQKVFTDIGDYIVTATSQMTKILELGSQLQVPSPVALSVGDPSRWKPIKH